MVAANAEDAPAAQQVEIAGPGAVEEIGPLAAHEAGVVADGLEHADHRAVHVAGVEGEALGFAFGVEGGNVEAGVGAIRNGRDRLGGGMVHRRFPDPQTRPRRRP